MHKMARGITDTYGEMGKRWNKPWNPIIIVTLNNVSWQNGKYDMGKKSDSIITEVCKTKQKKTPFYLYIYF